MYNVMISLFDKRNYGWMGIGYVLVLSGFLLMCGPGSTDSFYNPDIFSFRRIGIAPFIALSGFIAILVGICLPHKESRP